MEKLPMCRMCLVDNVPMFRMVNRNLHDLYEKLTDNPFVTDDCRPMLACSFCYAKLKQCFRLLIQSLEAEERFAQKMNEDYKDDYIMNQDLSGFFSGFSKSPIELISIVDECQTESIAAKVELPAVSEILDNIIEPKEEYQSEELEPETLDNSCLDVEDIPPLHSEPDLEYDVPIVEFKIEVEEQEVTEEIQRARDTKKLEPETFDNSYLVVHTPPPHYSESDSEDKVPLMEFKTEAVEEQEVKEKKRGARDTKSLTVAKKPKQGTRKIKTAEQTKKEKSDSKAVRKTQKLSFKRGSHFTEAYKSDQPSNNGVERNKQHARSEKPYKCDFCQQNFSFKCYLIEHIRIHTGEKPYKCDICQRSFIQNSHLTEHIRIHSGEKPYKCDVCQRSFNQNTHLTAHARIHTGEKPYKCHVCQRSFGHKCNLTNHIRTHTGEKPYKCHGCQRNFSVKSGLIKHVRIHTGEKPYKCHVCQCSFRVKGHLLQHVRIHTGEKP